MAFCAFWLCLLLLQVEKNSFHSHSSRMSRMADGSSKPLLVVDKHRWQKWTLYLSCKHIICSQAVYSYSPGCSSPTGISICDPVEKGPRKKHMRLKGVSSRWFDTCLSRWCVWSVFTVPSPVVSHAARLRSPCLGELQVSPMSYINISYFIPHMCVPPFLLIWISYSSYLILRLLLWILFKTKRQIYLAVFSKCLKQLSLIPVAV